MHKWEDVNPAELARPRYRLTETARGWLLVAAALGVSLAFWTVAALAYAWGTR